MGGPPSESLSEGDNVLLYYDERRKWLVRILPEKEFHTHKGILRFRDLIGKSYGESALSTLGERFFILKPTTYDYVMNMQRITQIMYPKDIGLILLRLGVGPGKIVIEAGTGSGAMTVALANAVGPDGHIFTYEIRLKFIRFARKNLKQAGVLDCVTIKHSDATLGFDELGVDAVVLDLAEPWKVVPFAYKSLKGGRPLACFSPTMNQVEKTVLALREGNFADLETVECLVREMRVALGKTRPSTIMVGHTGYVTFARRVTQQGSEARAARPASENLGRRV